MSAHFLSNRDCRIPFQAQKGMSNGDCRNAFSKYFKLQAKRIEESEVEKAARIEHYIATGE